MTGVVVPLNHSSAASIAVREANPEVIEKLEQLLEQAKAGEVTGLAYAALHPGDLTSWSFAGRTTRGLLGATMLCQGDLVKTTLENV